MINIFGITYVGAETTVRCEVAEDDHLSSFMNHRLELPINVEIHHI